MYNVKSVIDIGCGYAQSLKYFIERGVEGIGIEGWDEAINKSFAKEHIIKHDYTVESYIPQNDFDLGWSCEFVEHVEEKYIGNFLETFKKCKYIAMTHAVPNQNGHHHVNCKDSNYWIDILKANGFKYLEEDSQFLRKLLFNEDGTPLEYGRYVGATLMIFKKDKNEHNI
jgi:cyclopropane fatty-acyl-phospholipid synthase-like methyltransferase